MADGLGMYTWKVKKNMTTGKETSVAADKDTAVHDVAERYKNKRSYKPRQVKAPKGSE